MQNKNKDTRRNIRMDTDVHSYLRDINEAERVRLGRKTGFSLPIGGLLSNAVRGTESFREWVIRMMQEVVK